MTEQLLLPIKLQEKATFDNFMAGSNQQLVEVLKDSVNQPQGKSIFLWGAMGLGKTHLLQACCHLGLSLGKKVAYISLKNRAIQPAMLSDFGVLDVVCLDDVHVTAQQDEWEKALFSLYNQMTEKNAVCIISSQFSPKMMGLKLPDLESRFSWGFVYHLQTLSDEEKLQLLQQRANERGLVLSEEVGYFLFSRCSREITFLMALLNRLDEASIVSQRKLTVPFVKLVLGI